MQTLRPGRMSLPGTTEPTEAITRARAGDAEAWGQLYRVYAPAIFRFCRRAMPTREDAEDATMEVFMKLRDKLGQYDMTRSFSAWLYKMAANHCWDMLRRRKIRQDKETEDLESVPLEHPDPNQLDKLIEQRTSEEVRRALDKLGARARVARTAAGAGRQRRAGGGRSLLSETPEEKMKHLDEMTLLLYIERQLERTRGLEVSAHTQECDACRTLLRALELESRLLTRAMLEEDEPLPSRLAQFQERARRSMQWIWGLVFGLAATGVYALYTGYIQPWQQQLEQAGFGGSNLLGLLMCQCAMWKGWRSMMTLLEVLAMVTLAGLGAMLFRRRMRRGSALALVFTGFCAAFALAPAAAASETRKGPSVGVSSDETIKGDIFLFGDRVKIDGTVEGDVFLFGHDATVNGHVQGDVIGFAQTLQVSGKVDGNVRAFTNTLTIRGTVAKNVLTFDERVNLESEGKIGGR